MPLSSTLGIWWPPSATPQGLVELCQKPACPNTARWSRTKLDLARTTFVVGSEKASYSLCSTADLFFPELTWSQQANSEISWCEPAMLHSPTSEEKKSAWNSLNKNMWKCSLGPSAYCGKWYITNMLIITAILGGRNNKFVSKALLKFMFLQSPQWILEGMTLGTQLQCFQQVIPFSPSTTKEEKGNLGISALYPLTNKKLN